MYICQSQSPDSSYLPILPLVSIRLFVLYFCVSISSLQIGSFVQFFLDSTHMDSPANVGDIRDVD